MFCSSLLFLIEVNVAEWLRNNEKLLIIALPIIILFVVVISVVSKKEKPVITLQSVARINTSSSNTTNPTNQKVIIIGARKSVGLAILLAIIFPYFGILYSTVSGFFILFLSYIFMWVVIFYFGFKTYDDGWLYIGAGLSIIHFLVSIIWAGISANNYNKRLQRQ